MVFVIVCLHSTSFSLAMLFNHGFARSRVKCHTRMSRVTYERNKSQHSPVAVVTQSFEKSHVKHEPFKFFHILMSDFTYKWNESWRRPVSVVAESSQDGSTKLPVLVLRHPRVERHCKLA